MSATSSRVIMETFAAETWLENPSKIYEVIEKGDSNKQFSKASVH